MNAEITLYPDFSDLVFTWSGGSYIDVWFSDPSNKDHTGAVINVYDYAKGKASIPFTPAAMERACKRYVDDLTKEMFGE